MRVRKQRTDGEDARLKDLLELLESASLRRKKSALTNGPPLERSRAGIGQMVTIEEWYERI